MKYKLERTRKCILSNDIVVSGPKIAKQIQAVETLLERVEKDQFLDEISKEIHKEFSKLRRRAEFMERNDLKKAFALMHKNIWGWWD